jgi:hypothetical protein
MGLNKQWWFFFGFEVDTTQKGSRVTHGEKIMWTEKYLTYVVDHIMHIYISHLFHCSKKEKLGKH